MSTNTKEKIKRLKLRRILVTVILAAAAAVVLVLIVWYQVLTLQTVQIRGNSLYSAETIEEEIREDEKTWNTLYTYMKYRDGGTAGIPYLEGMTVSITDPHTLLVEVTEKDVLGYLYDEDAQLYIAFDADGLVLRTSESAFDGEILIRGLSVESCELYEKMDLADSSVLDTLESVKVLLESYDCLPDSIAIRTAGTILLDYDKIQVNLGTGVYLNEKIARMVKLWDRIENRTGTLHLETWTESTTDIHFRKKELLDLDDPDATYTAETTDEDADAETTDEDADAEAADSDADSEDGTDTQEQETDDDAVETSESAEDADYE